MLVRSGEKKKKEKKKKGRGGASFKKEMIETGGQRVTAITGLEGKRREGGSKTALFIIRSADGESPGFDLRGRAAHAPSKHTPLPGSRGGARGPLPREEFAFCLSFPRVIGF